MNLKFFGAVAILVFFLVLLYNWIPDNDIPAGDIFDETLVVEIISTDEPLKIHWIQKNQGLTIALVSIDGELKKFPVIGDIIEVMKGNFEYAYIAYSNEGFANRGRVIIAGGDVNPEVYWDAKFPVIQQHVE